MEEFIADETRPPVTPQNVYLQFVHSYVAMLRRCGVDDSAFSSRDPVQVVKTMDHVRYPEEELCKYTSDAVVQVLRESTIWPLLAGCADTLDDPIAPNEAGRKHLARLAACSGDLTPEPRAASFLGVDMERLGDFAAGKSESDNSCESCISVHIYGSISEWRMLSLVLRDAFEKEGCLDAVPEEKQAHLRNWVDRAIAAVISFSFVSEPDPNEKTTPVAASLPLLAVRSMTVADRDDSPRWQVGGFLNALLPYDVDTPFSSGFIPWVTIRPEELSFEEDWPCCVVVPDKYREPMIFMSEKEIDDMIEPDATEEYVMVRENKTADVAADADEKE